MLTAALAQSPEEIMADIYEQVAEYGGDLENLTQELQELAACPINVNTATAEDLQRLRFLSDVQIDAILNYVNKHPMADLSELRLIGALRDYEIRDLTYFLVAQPVTHTTRLYPKEVFAKAKHELTLRVDGRNIEKYTGDPIYGQLRYRYNYHKQEQFGVTLQRNAGQDWRAMRYGGYVQLSRLTPHLKTLVLGNFQGQFGQGLVLGQAIHRGKSSYLMAAANGAEGVSKYSSVSPDYDYLHGIATTLSFGPVDVSALYSIRQEQDSLWHHVVGLNATYRRNRLKIGLTALEELYRTDSTHTAFGLNARYNLGRWDFFGEVAASCNTSDRHPSTLPRWGCGVLVGTRITPINGLGLVLLYRYYSPSFINRYAFGFAETSNTNDENGCYIGSEIKLVKHWRCSS